MFKNIEDGMFSYYYALKNNTLLDRSKLVCTMDDLARLKDILSKSDVIESSSPERMNTNWRLYKLTNLTVFATLLKDLPMGCNNAILPDFLLKNGTINWVKYEKNTRQPNNSNLCLFRSLALQLHGNQPLEEKTSKIFNSFIKRKDELSPNQFLGVHMNDNPVVEHLLTLNILLYDIKIVDGNLVGEFARRSLRKYENTVRLLRYKHHICYVSNHNAVFQCFCCFNCDNFFKKQSIWSNSYRHEWNE